MDAMREGTEERMMMNDITIERDGMTVVRMTVAILLSELEKMMKRKSHHIAGKSVITAVIAIIIVLSGMRELLVDIVRMEVAGILQQAMMIATIQGRHRIGGRILLRHPMMILERVLLLVWAGWRKVARMTLLRPAVFTTTVPINREEGMAPLIHSESPLLRVL